MTDFHQLLTGIHRMERIADDAEQPPSRRLHDIRVICDDLLTAAGWRVPADATPTEQHP